MTQINETTPNDTGLGTILLLGNVVELLINFVGIPLSIVNLCLVARTSVIHPNMKAILIFQSFVLMMRACCRLVICLFKFILWNPIVAEKTDYFPALGFIYLISVYSRNCVVHVLIIERVLATQFVRTYEQRRNFLFTMLWLITVLTIAIYTAFTTEAKIGPPISTFLTTAFQFVIGSMELAIFYMLARYNAKIYRKMLQNNNASHSLSLRYQLSENIRIGKQLIPPLSLNLCIIFFTNIIVACGYFMVPYFLLIYGLCTALNSFIGLLIELVIITCHPFLKRDFFQISHCFGTMFRHFCLKFLPNNHRIGDETVTVSFNNSASAPSVSASHANGIAQRDLISGKALIDQANPDEHFAMLAQAWEIKPFK